MTSDTNNLWPITGPHFQIGSLFKARHASTKSWSQVEKKAKRRQKKLFTTNTDKIGRKRVERREEGLEGLKAGGGVK